MSKKFYTAPVSEELMLEIEGDILVGSPIEDGAPVHMGGSDGEEDDGL